MLLSTDFTAPLRARDRQVEWAERSVFLLSGVVCLERDAKRMHRWSTHHARDACLEPALGAKPFLWSIGGLIQTQQLRSRHKFPRAQKTGRNRARPKRAKFGCVSLGALEDDRTRNIIRRRVSINHDDGRLCVADESEHQSGG